MFKIPISSLKKIISFIKLDIFPEDGYPEKNEDGIPQRKKENILKTRCYVKYLYGDEAYSTSETKVKQRVDFYIRNRRDLRDKLTNDCKINYDGWIFDIIYINFLGEFVEIRGERNYEITNYGAY